MKLKRQKRPKPGEPYRITKAVTHIRLKEGNTGKLAALDALAEAYLALCQLYVTLFCTEERPDAFHTPLYPTQLSERWHRVAIQQAAGITKSWRTNREQAYQDYLNDVEEYQEQVIANELPEGAKEPVWQEWDVPTLHQTCIQANTNVVMCELPQDSSFDYWLRVSTLERGKTLLIPVKLADYHREALTDPETGERRAINSSVQLNKRVDGWWLTLSYDEVVTIPSMPDTTVVGIDVGIANFLTTSTGKYYGSFHAKLRGRQKQDREKRRRKAKLRACLEKKGVIKLPSKSTKEGQRLTRHVKQEINRAVNECFADHPEAEFAYEQLSVATMKFKARAQNAYLRASHLGHIPKQIAWKSVKEGKQATKVKSAYSSQECHMCYYVDRKNRPDQQTFRCRVCGHSAHADLNASMNIARRLNDSELQACKGRKQVKSLLLLRHAAWKRHHGWS